MIELITEKAGTELRLTLTENGKTIAAGISMLPEVSLAIDEIRGVFAREMLRRLRGTDKLSAEEEVDHVSKMILAATQSYNLSGNPPSRVLP